MFSMSKRIIRFLVASAALLAAGTTVASARTAQEEDAPRSGAEQRILRDLELAARERVALRAQATVSSLRVTNAAAAHYPMLGLTRYAYKIVDDASGELARSRSWSHRAPASRRPASRRRGSTTPTPVPASPRRR